MKDLQQLNDIYRTLSPGERISRMYSDFDKILVTSSFGITSAFLLNLISKIMPQQTICFLDTG
jgi:phosphoadenosine phosphosulfate reductase